jgi:hypothetical protein
MKEFLLDFLMILISKPPVDLLWRTLACGIKKRKGEK